MNLSLHDACFGVCVCGTKWEFTWELWLRDWSTYFPSGCVCRKYMKILSRENWNSKIDKLRFCCCSHFFSRCLALCVCVKIVSWKNTGIWCWHHRLGWFAIDNREKWNDWCLEFKQDKFACHATFWNVYVFSIRILTYMNFARILLRLLLNCCFFFCFSAVLLFWKWIRELCRENVDVGSKYIVKFHLISHLFASLRERESCEFVESNARAHT